MLIALFGLKFLGVIRIPWLDATLRAVRDLFTEEVDRLVTSQGYRGVFRRADDICHIIQDRVTVSPSGRERIVEDLESDPGAGYEWTMTIDASSLGPMVATPGDPGNGN